MSLSLRTNVTSVLSLLLASLASAQGRLLWSHESPGLAPGVDDGNAVAVGPHGESYVAAVSTGTPIGSPPASNRDALVQKRDAYGTLLWERRIDLGENEYASEIVHDAANDALYVAGLASNLVGFPPVPVRWLMWKLDAQTGTIAWERTYAPPGSGGGYPTGLVRDAAGGIVLSGFVYPASPVTESDAVVLRYAADGSQTWEWRYASPSGGYDVASSPSADALGNVVVAVRTGDFGPRQIVKLSPSGMPIWTFTTTDSILPPHVDAASNVIFAREATGDWLVEKLDAAGNPVWSLPSATVFGTSLDISGLVLDAGGSAYVTSGGARLARVDPAGTVVWRSSVPSTHLHDLGTFRGIAGAPNGDVAVLTQPWVAGSRRSAAVLRWSSAGAFLWGQALLARQSGADAEGRALAIGPLDSVVIAGHVHTTPEIDTSDLLVASLREQSRTFCFGDGSAGACPCGNDVPAGVPSGCAHFTGGPGARIVDFGIASVGDDTLRLHGTGLSGGSGAAVVVQSSGTGVVPFRDGLLCLSTPLRRMYTLAAAGGVLDVPPAGAEPFAARSASSGDPISPGSTRYYQVYYRPLTGLCGGAPGNTTNAIEVRWSS